MTLFTSIFSCRLESIWLFVVYPLSGVTVAGYGNGTSGIALNALKGPWGLVIDDNDSLYVSEYGNYRVIKIPAESLTGSFFAGTRTIGTSVTQLCLPTGLAIDAN